MLVPLKIKIFWCLSLPICQLNSIVKFCKKNLHLLSQTVHYTILCIATSFKACQVMPSLIRVMYVVLFQWEVVINCITKKGEHVIWFQLRNCWFCYNIMSAGQTIEIMHAALYNLYPPMWAGKGKKIEFVPCSNIIAKKGLSLAHILWSDMQLNKSEFIRKTILQLQILTKLKYSIIISC